MVAATCGPRQLPRPKRPQILPSLPISPFGTRQEPQTESILVLGSSCFWLLASDSVSFVTSVGEPPKRGIIEVAAKRREPLLTGCTYQSDEISRRRRRRS
jgi:hypothetical protein